VGVPPMNSSNFPGQSPSRIRKRACVRQRLCLSGWLLALIGKASARESRGEDLYPSRGVFDKETRSKPLAFAADAGYGN
jgi:hypothetical protein